MNLFDSYLDEIERRKEDGLSPKPIDNGDLVTELISRIKDEGNEHRKISLDFFIYNTLPGTTSAAMVKANFLKEIVLGELTVGEISPSFALHLLSHMNGGPSVKVLLDLALGSVREVALDASEILKTQVFLYEKDLQRLKAAYENGNIIAK